MALDFDIQKRAFWALTGSEALEILKTNRDTGLSEEEAAERLKIFGGNILKKERRVTPLLIFLRQFKSPLIFILVIAASITFLIGHYIDTIFIFAAVIVNTLLGFYQENKAENALAELKTYLKPRAKVLRGGQEKEIDAEFLVPGDIVKFSRGDGIAADARLLFVNNLEIDESIITGEALPVEKSINPVDVSAAIGDRSSMVFAGTLMAQGVGEAVVCATDEFTEIGKIAELVAEIKEEKTPLQTAINRFSFRAGAIIVALTIFIFSLGIYYGQSPFEMFVTAVAIAVDAVPEGLPVALTVILAIGVQRMAKRKGIIRKLLAAETLGSVTVILTDKTGTLTMAQMELDKIIPFGGRDEKEILKYALIVSDVIIENPSHPPKEWRLIGVPLEKSLVRAAGERGIIFPEIKKEIMVLSSIPFSAEKKFAAALVHHGGKHFLIFHGAPDILLRHSETVEKDKNEIHAMIDKLAQGGERVLGVAVKEISAAKDFIFSRDLKLSELNFLGLLAFRDPIRPTVRDAIHRVEKAGIKTVIVTGDHRGTAEAVAREVGLNFEEEGVIDSSELQTLHPSILKKRLPNVRVFSRVSPEDKLRIAKAYQDAGEIVAMTGDGVNDAPSIKQADIGIAMGSGTEVARSVADLVLLDDNFGTIVAAIEEGRQTMNNVRKTLIYLLSNITDGLLLIGGSLLAGIPLPLNALQILWVNFFIDSFPAVSLAFEKDKDGLRLKSYNLRERLFDPFMKFLIIVIGVPTSAFLFFLYWWLLHSGVEESLARTFIFASFASYSLFLIFSVRNLDKSIFASNPFSNSFLVWAVAIGLALTFGGVYLPFFQQLFSTVPLPPIWLAGVAAIGILNIAAIEFGKWLFWRKR